MFDIVFKNQTYENFVFKMPGSYNLLNAAGSILACLINGISVESIKNGIQSYSGVKRRFEYHIKTEAIVYIDDYAHHPKEIEMALRSARDLYPKRKLTVVFQPHLYTRTRDFIDDFASALSAADQVLLLAIYPARELPIEGVNSSALLTKISVKQKGLYKMDAFPEVIADTDVLLTLGAGDIDTLIKPIKEYLTK